MGQAVSAFRSMFYIYTLLQMLIPSELHDFNRYFAMINNKEYPKLQNKTVRYSAKKIERARPLYGLGSSKFIVIPIFIPVH